MLDKRSVNRAAPLPIGVSIAPLSMEILPSLSQLPSLYLLVF